MNRELAYSQLTTEMRHWHVRRRWRDLFVWAPRGMLSGLMAAVLLATVSRMRPFLHNDQVGFVAAILAMAGLATGVAVLLLKRESLGQQARFADRQYRLQERVSTAVEIRSGRIATTEALAQQQLADTLQAIRSIDARAMLPLRLDRRDWLLISLAAALLLAAIFAPNPQSEALKKRQAVAESVAKQQEAVELIREEIVENPALSAAEKEQLLEPLENALQALSETGVSQEGAVATLSEAEAELRQLGDTFSQQELRQALQSAAQPLQANPNSQPFGDALGSGSLVQAAAAAAQLADSLAEMSASDLASLAEDLSETAEAIQGVDEALSGALSSAAQALRQGDTVTAQQALRQAAGTLQQRSQENAASQQAQSAAAQLEQGRSEVAQAGQASPGQTPGQGQGEGSGQGAGQGAGGAQGQGQGGGQGQGEGQGSGPGMQSNQGEGTGGPGPGGGHAENVFVPDMADLSGVPGIDIELPAECVANPANCGGLLSENPTEFSDQGSVVPYNQVYGDYRDAAHEALDGDYIPLGLKGYVRDYFSSLEP